ncbi:MAG: outer membrane lipoprotein chaperone LolA [Gammaproteobacteria bacterium]|nr:outer membrane lipoprotein chaperone LolA [Gammaproteobacteria bacterium]
MRKIRIAGLLMGGFVLARAIAAPTPDAIAASRVEDFLGQLTSLRAEFRQTVTDARGRLLERAEGSVALARPGRFRWDYRVPEQLIISDGLTVWLYDVELEQVSVRAAGDALAGTPAMLLAGDGDLNGDFEITDAGQQDGLDWSRLTPRREDGDFREVRLGFAGRELRRMTLFDRLGQTTELELLQVERNPRFDSSLFKFEPPPGVDVVGRVPVG